MTPNPYAAAPPPPAPKPNRLPWVLAIVAVAALCLCGVPLAVVAWSASLPEGGVRAGNQLDEKTRALVNRKAHLGDDEEIVSFYDTTLNMDGSECAALTTSRVIYWTSSTVSELALADVESFTHHSEPIEGDIISITSTSGRLMKIEIAPLNDGATFVAALERLTGKLANTASTPSPPADAEAPEGGAEPAPRHKRRK
jgi:hypothetical protein